MFDIKVTKTFMDSVHGYISVPKCFVENLIDTEYFQRLRNIDQTGMRILYPDAKHDRFGHSLGVFFLGQKAVDALLVNFLEDNYWNISSDNKKIVFWAKNKLLFLIACLLHDIGHTPFSHSLEEEIICNSRLNVENAETENKDLKTEFSTTLAQLIIDTETKGEQVEVLAAAPHEQLGAMLVLTKLKSNIEKIYDDLISTQYPNIKSDSILYAEHYLNKIVIDKEEFADDICFIARMILGWKYRNYTPERQIRNCFIELLNGDNFDVDKLDYIVRDTQMSGISNVAIDVERLLNSLRIVTKTVYNNKKFDYKKISDLTIQSLSNERENKNEVNIAGHFKGVLLLYDSAEVTIYKDSDIVALSGGGEGKNAYIKYLTGDCAYFSTDSIVFKNNLKLDPQKTKNGKLIPLFGEDNLKEFGCRIYNAKVKGEEFSFKVGKNPVELHINGNCTIKIKGKFKAKAPISLFKNNTISGVIQNIEILGNIFEKEITTNKIINADAYNAFTVGFKKQAVNLIANVLEARNYLYLWIYAHHKVIYYANFLIPILSQELITKNESVEDFPWWKLTYNDLLYLDDSYIWTVIKRLHYQHELKSEVKELCNELLERNYKKSLYKSLAEYDLLFEQYNEKQRSKIHSLLRENTDKSKPFVSIGNEILGGYVDSILDNLKEEDKGKHLSNITHLIFVDASYKLKRLNPSKIFIVFNDGTSSLDKIPLLNDQLKTSLNSTADYFYLYFSSSSCNSDDVREETTHLRSAVSDYFYEYVNE